MKDHTELTKAEEQVMNILWKLGKGFIKNIVAGYPSPKPAYTTVATIINILEKKGFVKREPMGNTNEYHPVISKDKYTDGFLKRFVDKYFSSSYKNLVSSLSSREDMSTEDMEEIVGLLQSKLKDKRKGTS